jgi:hypothetical protein
METNGNLFQYSRPRLIVDANFFVIRIRADFGCKLFVTCKQCVAARDSHGGRSRRRYGGQGVFARGGD